MGRLTFYRRLDYNKIIMTQKVIKVGDSLALVIPKESAKDLGIKSGDRAHIGIDKKQGRIFYSFTAEKKEIDKEFLDWTKKFIERYRPALEALADK